MAKPVASSMVAAFLSPWSFAMNVNTMEKRLMAMRTMASPWTACILDDFPAMSPVMRPATTDAIKVSGHCTTKMNQFDTTLV